MSLSYHKPPSVGYIAYIDESGDDGIRRVKPIDPSGATEWFVLSAVVVRVDRELEVLQWVRDTITALEQHQRKDLHFRDLSSEKKKFVCSAIAEKPLRCFAVLSNKKNMRQYRNQRAEKVPARNWFYCWMTRLLLERVTQYCGRRSLSEHGSARSVRLEFSQRGGMSYSQFRAYMTWLRLQSGSGSLFLPQGDLDWSVVDVNQVFAYGHRRRAGLQLADTVASAFYQAVDINKPGICDPQFAELLAPRMCLGLSGEVYGFGVKLMPHMHQARLLPKQRHIFDYYMQQDKRRAPGP